MARISLRLRLLFAAILFVTIGFILISITVYESYIGAYITEQRHIIAELLHRQMDPDLNAGSDNIHHHKHYLTFRLDSANEYRVIDKTIDLNIEDVLAQIQAQKDELPLLELKDKRYLWVVGQGEHEFPKIYTIYELPGDLFPSFVNAFGTEFVIVYIVGLWAIIWAALIVASLFEKIKRQKDLLEKQTHELEIKRDEALQQSLDKGKFLANVSHELRAPLNSLLGYSEMLLQSDQDMRERVAGINTIIRNGEYMLNLVNDLLDLGKIEAGKLEIDKQNVQLFEIMSDVQHLFATQASRKNIEFDFDYQFPVPKTIYTDPLRFKQILVNLVSNAIKFTSAGYVKVETAYNTDGTLHVYVRDSGIGLTEEHIHKIFDEYTQADKGTARQYGGTGLGLSLSNTLAQLLGGKILVSSTPGRGSVFTLEIDVGVQSEGEMCTSSSCEREMRSIYTPENHDAQFVGRVLLVDDNTDNQSLFTNYLQRHGLNVVSAFNGKEALVKVQKESFDLIFMDAQMPVIDGITATRIMRDTGVTTPVVALTGNASWSDSQEFMEAGCNEYLTKPIRREHLLRVCKRFLTGVDKSSQVLSPLHSSLLQDEPGLQDIVVGFVNRYPQILATIREKLRTGDIEDFEVRIHELKGTGGNVGYLDITRLCGQIEFQFSSGAIDEVQYLLNRLEELHPRMQQGLPTNQTAS